MSCRCENTSPDQQPGDETPTDEACTTCPQNCPSVEIEINNTSSTDDDLVLVKCLRPTRRSRIPCRIKSTSAGANHTIVLTNPDGRLRFAGAADTTRILTVPDNGNWVAFEISGETGSAAMNDAVIEAHCMTASGPLVGSKTVTVVHFDRAKMDIATPGTYSLLRGRFTASGGSAADYEMSARIRPTGVSCSAPQIQDLKVGMIQNLELPYQKLKTWSGPTIAWNAGVASGTRVDAPDTVRLTINVPARTNDSESSVAPIYDQPGKTGTIDSDSLKPPSGCSGSGTATTSDTPSTPFPAVFTQPAKTSTGNVVGTLTYSRDHVELRKQFTSWCVIFNTSTNDLCTLRERKWRLFVASNGTGPQKATKQAATAPTSAPITAPPFGNARTNDRSNHSEGPVGTGTVPFVKA